MIALFIIILIPILSYFLGNYILESFKQGIAERVIASVLGFIALLAVSLVGIIGYGVVFGIIKLLQFIF